MFAFLKKPYPFIGDILHDLKSNFLIGLFVALFLAFFQPFQINEWETPNKLLKLAGFGFVSFAVPSLFNFLIPRIVSRNLIEDNWKVWNEIVTILFVLIGITLGNLAYGVMLGIMLFKWEMFTNMLLITLVIGVFPVTVHVLFKHNRLLRRNLKLTLELNRQFEEHDKKKQEAPAIGDDSPELKETEIILFAENNKDRLVILLSQLLFIESADNYSNIVYLENGARKKQMLRSSLKRIESQISHPSIMRCHRAFIVNLDQVSRAEGNAAGYRLFIKGSEESVPVSRNNSEELKEKLKRSGI